MIASRRIQSRQFYALRRGTTIIELIGMLGLLMVIGATTHRSLGNITRASREGQMSRAGRMEIERFADTLRQDGGGASSVQADDNLITFDSPQRQVRYRWNEGQPLILREVFVDGDRQAVDRFRLRFGTKVESIVSNAIDDGELLSVKLSNVKLSNGKDPGQLSTFLIEVGI